MSYCRFVLVLVGFCLLFPLISYADGQPAINEFLPHPSSGNREWVEFYIPDGASLSNCWIDDDTDFGSDSGSSAKEQITTVTSGSDSQHVIYELSSSMFNNDGDTIALFAPDGTLIDQYSYASDPGVDISIGRTPDATGGFQVLAGATRGSANSSAKPTDTPTPAPTDKPTKAPKSTETPVPTKVKTTSSSSVVTSTKNVIADATSISNAPLHTSFANTTIGSNGAHPTSVLGTHTKAVLTPAALPKKRILIKGSTNSISQVVVVTIGGIMLLLCGILMYLKKRGIWIFQRDK
ncbi:MAG TPA: lamin tail domain-containing protein [Candidatus Saccharimonadales bacterium]|nr:lamin tail domain-containing protein [Candidatus Saccharimonadales bacterium]